MRLALAVLFVTVGSLEAQQPPAGREVSLQFKVLDIIFHVEDIGGRVEELVVRESETDVRVELAADVLFEFDKADLLPKAEETLARAAEFVKQRSGGGVIRIEGHTDGKGSASYNRQLSLRRAESVRKWMEAHGLSGLRFTTEGFGADKPVAPNTKPDGSDDPEGRQKNRRVEIVIGK